jgi:hypothetical protein
MAYSDHLRFRGTKIAQPARVVSRIRDVPWAPPPWPVPTVVAPAPARRDGGESADPDRRSGAWCRAGRGRRRPGRSPIRIGRTGAAAKPVDSSDGLAEAGGPNWPLSIRTLITRTAPSRRESGMSSWPRQETGTAINGLAHPLGCPGGQAPSPPAFARRRGDGRMSSTAIRPTSWPPIATGTDRPSLKISVER